MSGAYRGLRRACTSAVGVRTRFLVEYEPIRSDPRFNELLHRVHLATGRSILSFELSGDQSVESASLRPNNEQIVKWLS
jgi:hypothetical protein